jgi:signal transduction histidine kinase
MVGVGLQTALRPVVAADPTGTPMRLATFIEQKEALILDAAEAFAATLLPAAGHLNADGLRDHLPMILAAICKDLGTPQTAAEELRKSWGNAPLVPDAPETAAQTHAMLRAKSGFDVRQLVSEYRALRASVLRLFLAEAGALSDGAIGDLLRFNEAIDQAIAESVSHFSIESDRWREVFLAVLGHDLRGPLNAVLLTAELLSRLGTEGPVSEHTARLMRSGRRMQSLLDSLLDYSRSSLGRGIAIQRSFVDLAEECREEIELLRAALPEHRIELFVEGVTTGNFDPSRVRESLSNLVSNANRYASEGTPVVVRLVGGDRAVRLSVENRGPTIGGDLLPLLFEPLRRGASQPEASLDRSNLGLGLFIVQGVAEAHGGNVEVESKEGRTVFTVTFLT